MKKEKLELSEKDNWKIIEELRDRPILWDATNRGHKNVTKLAENWLQIAEAMDEEGEKRNISGKTFHFRY